MITVLYFAAARDKAGAASERLDVVAGETVAGLRARLARLHPALVPVLKQSRIAVAQRFAKDEDAVVDDVEVAVIPPVAGG